MRHVYFRVHVVVVGPLRGLILVLLDHHARGRRHVEVAQHVALAERGVVLFLSLVMPPTGVRGVVATPEDDTVTMLS